METVDPLGGHGSDERAWQQCEWLWQRPDSGPEALCGDATRLVVLAPHPDDEVLGCGGLMHSAVQLGLPVRVVAVTDGEACYPGERWWTPERLRQARRQELHAALAELGVAADAVAHLQMADGSVARHEAALQAWLHQELQPHDLLLVPWRFDGHPDHEAAGRAGWRAARQRSCRCLEYPVWGWHWLDPACAHMAWESPRLLDVSTMAERKQRALAAFRTQTGQVPNLQAEPVLGPQVLARFTRSHEVFLA